MKTRKLYEIRIDQFPAMPRSIGCRFRPYNRARKLAAYLRRRYQLDTTIAAWNIAVGATDNTGRAL